MIYCYYYYYFNHHRILLAHYHQPGVLCIDVYLHYITYTIDYIQSDQLNMAFLELGTIVSKFGRQIKTWHEIYEDVAKRFVKVAVELRKGPEIKSILSSYRNLCQASELKSFANVVLLYLDQAEKRAQKAIEKSKSKSLALDLENEIPENVLLSDVSGEDLKDRTDREFVTPWMRFLWETYRVVLELLKTTKEPQLEAVYHVSNNFPLDVKLTFELSLFRKLVKEHLNSVLNTRERMNSRDFQTFYVLT